MTVNGRPFSRTERPTIDGSPPNRACQYSCVSDHRRVATSTPFIRLDESTDCRSHAEQREVVVGDRVHRDAIGRVVSVESGDFNVVAGEIDESRALLPIVLQVGKRDAVRCRDVPIRGGADGHEFFRTLDGHRPQHERIQHGKDHDHRRHADGHRQHGRAGEHRRPAQRAQRVTDVAPCVFEPPQAVAVPKGFFHLLHSAEGAPSRETRRVRCHSATLVFSGKQLEVHANLIIEIEVPLPSPD